jgi:hypothetical protein
MRQAPARSAISRLVQKFELTGSVCGNKKSVIGRHRSSRTRYNVAREREALLRCPRKCVTRCIQLLGINTRHHATGFDVVSLQIPSGTDAHCSQQAAET